MKFVSHLILWSDPNTVKTVVVDFRRFHVEGFPATKTEAECYVRIDTDSDGTPDTLRTIPQADFVPRIDVPDGQLGHVDIRMTGGGNMMTTIRNQFKALVVAHNQEVNATLEATISAPYHSDIDTDSV